MQDQRSPVLMSQEGLQDLPETPSPRPCLVRPLPTSTAQTAPQTAPVFSAHDWPLIARHPPATVPATLPWRQVPGIGPLPRASCPSRSSGASIRKPCTQRRTRRPPGPGGPGAPGGCGPPPGCARLQRRPGLKSKGRTKGGRRDSRGRLSREPPGRSVSVGLFLRGSAGSRPPDVGAIFYRCPPLIVPPRTSVQFSNCRPELQEPTVRRGRVGRLGAG